MNSLAPRPIRALLGESFYVPRYQRGYRWTKREVQDLLDDVLAFVESPSGSFYCLQPVVVTRNGKRWDVIDGQQRLTTLSLILTCFNRQLPDDESRPGITLDYESRPESRDYLEKPSRSGTATSTSSTSTPPTTRTTNGAAGTRTCWAS